MLIKTKEKKIMFARKCDRCGVYYDNYNSEYNIIQTKNLASVHDIDLCPECNKRLEEWIKEKQPH